MKKMQNEKAKLSKSQFGTHIIDWEFGIDLNYSWIELLKATAGVIAKKLKYSPQSVRKITSRPRWTR